MLTILYSTATVVLRIVAAYAESSPSITPTSFSSLAVKVSSGSKWKGRMYLQKDRAATVAYGQSGKQEGAEVSVTCQPATQAPVLVTSGEVEAPDGRDALDADLWGQMLQEFLAPWDGTCPGRF